MPRFARDEDVLVDFDGIIHKGRVLECSRGHVLAVIEVDVEADYGPITPQLAPYSTVCVAESRVQPVSEISSD